MNIQDDKQAVANNIYGFAETLNSAEVGSVTDFYCNDGLFMPANFKTFSKADLNKSKGKFLDGNKLKISFKIDAIDIIQDVGGECICSDIRNSFKPRIIRSAKQGFICASQS